MSKLNQILIGILVVQIALTAFVFWPQPVASSGEKLLPDFAADSVTSLTIQDKDDNTITLAKSGDGWVLPDAGDFPVDAEKVTTLLQNIEAVNTNRLVTQTEASHSRLGVATDDFERKVDITFQDGSQQTLYIGTAAGAGATHVRLKGQSPVFLATDLTSFEASGQASGWIDTQYVSIPQDQIVALTLENENGTFEFEKDGDTWAMLDLAEDEIFNETALTGMLNSAASVRMTTPIGQDKQAEFGLDAPQAVVTLKTSSEEGGEQSYTLQVGAAAEDSGYYFKSSESPYFVTVSEFIGNSFIDKTRDDFLQEPPTAEPETEAEQ